MKITELAVAIAIIMAIITSGCATTPTGRDTQEDKIKIGVIAPLTGLQLKGANSLTLKCPSVELENIETEGSA